VVLVTSKGAESDKFWGKKQGADDHVVKPYSPQTLEAIIRRYVR
jgi:twitching motility two-component system response regulator PilH